MKKNIVLFIIIFFICFLKTKAQQVFTGYIIEKETLESISNATVFVKNRNIGYTSNTYGFFSVKAYLTDTLEFRSIGCQPLIISVNSLLNSAPNTIKLEKLINELNEVEVKSKPNQTVSQTNGSISIPIERIKKIPTLLGEKDIIKAIQLLPGIQKGTEGSTALYVRGGNSGQNLIVLDGAPVYNANHLFGFFSVFNGDALKNFDFYKNGFPARYGGVLSSVIDIQMKEGNKSKFNLEGGLGLLSSKILLEGPIKKSKHSFMISGRRTYFDVFTALMNSQNKTKYNFYDLNAKVNFEINKKTRIFVSSYFGEDKYFSSIKESPTAKFENEDLINWSNATATIRLNQIISEKVFLNTSIIYASFDSKLKNSIALSNETKQSMLTSNLNDIIFKSDLDIFKSNISTFKLGLFLSNQNLIPGVSSSNVNNIVKTKFESKTIGVYVENELVIGKFKPNIGLRLVSFSGSSKPYYFAEPRFNLNYSFSPSLNIQLYYSRNNQYLHLLSSSGVGLSTDLWIPSFNNIRPEQSDQVSMGIHKKINDTYSLSYELYRKNMRNILAFKENTSSTSLEPTTENSNWASNISQGTGLAFGNEILLSKNKGKLTGWVGYTLSWTIQQYNDINFGKKFFPRHDRRHDFSLVGMYNIKQNVHLSGTWQYASGNWLSISRTKIFTATNLPQAFGYPTTAIDYFVNKNSFQAAPFHRLDMSIQFFKKKKKIDRTWEFGIFNMYYRKNPLYYYYTTENNFQNQTQKLVLNKRSLFPILPFVNYNFTLK